MFAELIQSLAFIEESGGTRKNLLTRMTMTTCVIPCILIGCIGIPLNGFEAYAIVTVDDLRRQTRYILLLGMLLGNILIFVILFDEVAYYVSPSEELCKFYRSLLSVCRISSFPSIICSFLSTITSPSPALLCI